MWRPKGWTTPDRNDLPDWSVGQIYEAGADTILKAIKEELISLEYAEAYGDQCGQCLPLFDKEQ